MPEEFEATRKACAMAIAGHELVQAWRDRMFETTMVTREAIDHSGKLMAWADALLNSPV